MLLFIVKVKESKGLNCPIKIKGKRNKPAKNLLKQKLKQNLNNNELKQGEITKESELNSALIDVRAQFPTLLSP